MWQDRDFINIEHLLHRTCISGHSIFAIILNWSIILIQIKIQMYECKYSNFTFWNFKIFCKVCFFLTMVSSGGEGLSQLYLELVDAYKKRFMPQNGQVAVLKCSPIWKKIRKKFKTLSELKLKFIPKAWKQEAMTHKTPLMFHHWKERF